MDKIFRLFPDEIQQLLRDLPASIIQSVEEIRVRIEQPIEIVCSGKPIYPSERPVSAEEAQVLLNRLSQHSLYALEEELKRGYITISGGHRVGLAGKVITEHGFVKAIKEISSFNVRIARQKIGIAEPLIPYLFQKNWHNTLLIGPPQTGKTTLLRDIARLVSCGVKQRNIPSYKVGIVDERSEIAGAIKGIPQHSLGKRVDVLDACPKAEGMMMLIRSMSPQVLIVDEIGRKEDGEAILEAMHAGVQMIFTAHGRSLEDALKRPVMKPLSGLSLFQRYVILSRDKGPGTIQRIYDGSFKEIYRLSGCTA
ncbi:stage III sporulation protein AA [Fictibacillus nanhaiensis]|jgi:stage III sporulation protein AA|uniref:stage III sporulation protein AA n=1 Tax=Fictibacillus nanhaiensis TaxID=742169 RepID=UPI00203E91F6|nr:stage III sporulation protein AA [Fictibacillus nanhaiensis]MCM3730649.1 stage III sporulation protein AA [Fictibacillus nanhaiensis]